MCSEEPSSEYVPPYDLGALSSPLAAMLSRGKVTLRDSKLQTYVDTLAESHKDVRLKDDQFLQITNWLDVNCPFHRSYWGRLNAKYQGHPNYRPNVTFEEALLRSVPESVVRAEASTETISAVSP